MTVRLHVMLGDGGVGKTTLAAAYSLALAEEGRNVALLSIDPARRLQSALGLADLRTEVRVATSRGALWAGLLLPDATLRRWATEALEDDAARERLLESRLFRIVADRLATTTDVIAAARIAEWVEQDASLTDFVVDTAPGRNGIELVRRPAALVDLLKERRLDWLRHAQPVGRWLLRALSPISGLDVIAELVGVARSLDQPARSAIARVERAQALLHQPTTAFFLVTAVREDAARGAARLAAALAEEGLAPTAVVVNRTLPLDVGEGLAALDTSALGAEARTVVRYARASAEVQASVLEAAKGIASALITLPAQSGLDEEDRLRSLVALGRVLAQRVHDHERSAPRV